MVNGRTVARAGAKLAAAVDGEDVIFFGGLAVLGWGVRASYSWPLAAMVVGGCCVGLVALKLVLSALVEMAQLRAARRS